MTLSVSFLEKRKKEHEEDEWQRQVISNELLLESTNRHIAPKVQKEAKEDVIGARIELAAFSGLHNCLSMRSKAYYM